MATDLGFACPAGAKWYACGAASISKFVGCCVTDPCSNGCQQGNVRPVSFNTTLYGTFPDASCGIGSGFYTCRSAGNTFWGCCKTNACASDPPACKDGDLVSAFLDKPEQFSVYAASPPSEVETSTGDGGASTGVIVGGAVGGGLVVASIVGVIVFFLLRRRRNINARRGNSADEANVSTPMMKERLDDRLSAQYAMSPPPTYSSPNPNTYTHVSHGKNVYPTYRNDAQEPQELPGDAAPNTPANRYSELPAEAESSRANRYSELPAHGTTELESPVVEPRALQEGFSTDIAKGGGVGEGR